MADQDTIDSTRADPQFYNRNPAGVNQHPHCPRPGDAEIERILREFHAQAITNRKLISQLLKSEYGIIMSDTTVSRRRRALGLSGQITSKQFVPKATQDALRAQARARERERERASVRPARPAPAPPSATTPDDLFGSSPEPEPEPLPQYEYDPLPPEASAGSATPEPLPAPPARKRRRTAARRQQQPPPVTRCLVTLEHEPPETIGKCYLLGHGTPSARIRQLEYAWGYKAGTLDLESADNKIHLRADIRCSFDDGGFVILPDLNTIKRIYRDTVDYMLAHDGARPPRAHIFPHESATATWTYDFVPLKLLSQNVTIHRRSLDPSSQPPTSPSAPAAYTLHHPPFPNFPKLECAAHPFFAIANAVEKFRKNVETVLRYPHLVEVRMALLPLWDVWTVDPPEGFFASGGGPVEGSSSFRVFSVGGA
ncbi:hypothetical protein GLOTRDRAFT_134926 [Gloeophyllum trabeum ATCC 11539]|uniref:HNH nuclease domain-containing protein n=1 Tax=Gloeophyllum trabeum (strain ATCC 11539 / FP-39264 / Madison 617) TaxID=670483 RepID=S7QKC5_GLOTA|nr:uncharacterized protein GLOTRDRAFT_134926 [Gloeophyllum trabeum ATCC 11539]EPQ60201.1 hypothetical protein GLOTRDRAFT_134926 [Gloeophyllum trabeum ATCC 11539]